MKLPPYWVRVVIDDTGQPIKKSKLNADPDQFPKKWEGFWAFGWSYDNKDDAYRCGVERARRIRSLYHDELLGDDLYPYPDRPVREEIIAQQEAQGWAITRNGYGSLVLNAACAMFIDIDLSPIRRLGWVGGLLGLHTPKPAEPVIANIRDTIASLPGFGGRLYQTAAGLRLLVTSHPHDPTSDLTQDLLISFDADKRYTFLCKQQDSFRARLTPKPWRCKCESPPALFPRESRESCELHARWLERYNHAILPFGVCQLVEHMGMREIHPQIQPVVAIHDQYVLHSPDKPLA